MRALTCRNAAALVLLLLAACSDSGSQSGQPQQPAQTALPEGSGFDFYVLALSWSPSYCAEQGADANRQQCGSARPYGFIVHGLWPQFERGYPSDCPTNQPLDVPANELGNLYDIMPSAGLIRHEWKKHGTCSGLTREEYFATLRAAYERVRIPEPYRRLSDYRIVDPGELERAFLAANTGSDPAGIAITCGKRFLREVRICLTKTLDFRACPELERSACRLPKAVMPPERGG